MNSDIKILIIEDDNDINNLLSDMLTVNGYSVKSAFSGTEALIYINQQKFQMILLDLMLPGKTGEEVLEFIREQSNVPVIIISAKEEQGIRPRLLRAGADDFITKPFDIDEALARVEANLRRRMNHDEVKVSSNVFKYKEITVRQDERTATVNDNIINLTAREFGILELLVRYPSKAYSKANLFSSVWGEDYLCDDNTITVHISNLRNKIIKAGAKEEYIKTIWGMGYKLEV